MAYKFTTGLTRLSYAHIFQPAPDLNGSMKYSASIILQKTDEKTHKRYKATIDKMLVDPEVIKILGSGGHPQLPLHDGDVERADDAAYKNAWYFNAKANPEHKPRVLDLNKEEVIDPSEVYSGCYVQAVLSFYPYNKGGNRGIGCSLGAIRKIKDGPPLTGIVISDNDFDDSLLSNIDDLF